MGVFTVTRQVKLGLNLMPPWWLSGASIDLDFRNQRYYDSSLAVGVQSLAPLSSYLSCTRASTGYAKTSIGALTSFGNNVLRITDLGLLIEEARTNLSLYSADLTQGSVTLSGATISSSGTAPDGSGSQKVVEDTSTTIHGIYRDVSLTPTGGQAYSYSVYLQASGRSNPQITIGDKVATTVQCAFDLSAGTAGTPTITGGSNWSNATSAIEQLTGGWWRCSVTATLVSASGVTSFRPQINLSAASYTGDGSSGLLMWGAQLEAGAFATSYIPTASATVTRAFDNVQCSGSLSTILKALPQSAFVDLNSIINNNWYILGDSGSSQATLLSPGTSGTSVSCGVSASFPGGISYASGVKVAEAQATGSGGRSCVGGGGTVATDTNASTVASASVCVGSLGGNAGTIWNGYFRRIAVWNSKLADATLRSMTYPAGTTDTTAWVAAVISNGGTVSSARQALVDTLINGLKTDGVWAKLDALWLFAAENSQSALTDIVGGLLASAVSAPTFTTDRGYAGNGTSSYINTNFNPLTGGKNYVQNSAHYSAWAVTARSAGTGLIMGSNDTLNNTYFTYSGDNNIYSRVNETSQSGAQGIPGTTTGHILSNRSGASASQAYLNGSLFSSPNSTSVSLPSPSILYVGGGGPTTSYSNSQIAMASIGGSLTATDVTNLYNRLRTYMTAVGVP